MCIRDRVCCALFFTWRTRFVQFRLIREMIRLLIHPDKVQPEEIGHDELSMEVDVYKRQERMFSDFLYLSCKDLGKICEHQ